MSLLFAVCCFCNLFAQGHIEFSSNTIDLGLIGAEEPGTAEFEFKNTGNRPIAIKGVVSSNSKVVPNYSKEMIQPNQTGKIKVTYIASGTFSGHFKKGVTVTTTGGEEKIRLYLTGSVSEEKPKRYFKGNWWQINRDGKYGAEDAKGTIIVPPKYESLERTYNGFIARNGNTWYYYAYKDNFFVSISCDLLVTTNCDKLEGRPEGLIAKKGNTWSFYTHKGNLLLTIDCDELEIAENGLISAKRGNFYAYYDTKNGRCLISFERQCSSLRKVDAKNGLGIHYYGHFSNYWAMCNLSGKEVFCYNDDFSPYYINNRFFIVVHDDHNINIYDIHGDKKAKLQIVRSYEIKDNGDVMTYKYDYSDFSIKPDINFSGIAMWEAYLVRVKEMEGTKLSEEDKRTLEIYKKLEEQEKLGNISSYINPSKNPLR